ncbi:hypothetical protein ARALYDRAFT_330989 [Arabidopsis lyrata subsp. lyrata]|uniref:RNase H type-1 domain-containing protein n=1 Tax=Arabidopsis lyrata subsp. lyrata TaxID=81972 RepID=D7MN28_ARALL|nr:hypothetical protein ARALYDRAFT_330989 [Arabidopsis lyrata subsp. lyrata]
MLFQRKATSWRKIIRLARTDVQEWQDQVDYIKRFLSLQTHNSNPRQLGSNWEKPKRDWIKCNYDVLRDARETFLGACQAKGRRTCNALESEFQALIISMQNCWSKGFKRVCFEGDNKEVADLLNGNTLNFGMFNWIREARLWKSRFTDCQFLWFHRLSNAPTDLLAKHQIPFNSSFHFHSLVPHVITNALHNDFSNHII